MMRGPRATQTSTFFDWDQSNLIPQSENESWIQKMLQQDTTETPLNLFLETPLHSPNIRYHYWDEFHAIELNKALRELQSGIFGDPKASRIWLYDINGLQPRTYNGVMSAQMAHQSLQLKRFGDKHEPDAHIRRLHIPNPTAESMSVLIYDAKKSDLCVLRPFLWNHIRGHKNSASISFNFENGGLTFSITFQIPSFVLHTGDANKPLPEDRRQKTDKSPWRNSIDLSFLSTDRSRSIYTLHESQHSFAVYGHRKCTWKSAYLHDTYFYEKNSDNEDAIDYYDDDDTDSEECTEECAEEQEWDPSILGTLEAKTVSREPCEYFLVVLNERCKQWHDEWMKIFIKIQEEILNYSEKHSASTTAVALPISRVSAQEALKRIERNREWLKQTLGLLGLLHRSLDGIIDSWENFKDDLDQFPVNQRVFSVQKQISNEVKKMKGLHKGFDNLEVQCEQFRKDLELAIGVQSGPVMALQYSNVTFMQVITPVVVSAALIQAQIIPFGSQLVWFLLLNGGLFALNWHIEPGLSPIPSRWRAGIYNLFKGSEQGPRYSRSTRELDHEMEPYPSFGALRADEEEDVGTR